MYVLLCMCDYANEIDIREQRVRVGSKCAYVLAPAARLRSRSMPSLSLALPAAGWRRLAEAEALVALALTHQVHSRVWVSLDHSGYTSGVCVVL